ncbi:hypothetical protein DSECCO2_511090 [anaerobic digester metagenome]
MTHDRIPLWLNAELERELRRLAAGSGTSLSTLVEDALREFMMRSAALQDGNVQGAASPEAEAVCAYDGERRGCRRSKVGVPAVVHTSEQDGRTGRYRVAEVRDISATGIGLRFEGSERESMRVGRAFEILIQLGGQANPMRMACTACRKVLDEAGVIVGAVFNEPVSGLDESLTALS